MKDLAVFRRMVMVCLLLGSVYLVFDTVVTTLTSKHEKEKSESEGLEDFNQLIEKFEVLTPEAGAVSNHPSESGDSGVMNFVVQVEQQQREEQNRKDRALAQVELLKSVNSKEANRLLEQVAHPMIELEDIQYQPNPNLPENLPTTADELIGLSSDDPN
jgi:hypothetical protein